MPLDTQHSWRCACGRSVPVRTEVCRCGAHRDHVSLARRTEPSGTEAAASAWRPVLLVLAFGAATAAAWAWFKSVPAPEIRGAVPVASRPTSVPVPAATPDNAFGQTPLPMPSQPAWTPEPAPQPDQPGIPRLGGNSGVRPASAATPAPAETPSEMDVIRQKAEKWRALYRPVADRIARLEAEIPKLREERSRTLSITTLDGPRDPNIRTGAERSRDRLAAAENELAQARRELAQIEDEARRDGVASGQLY